MSVTTTFDEKTDQAKEKIGQAYNLLIEALKSDTWGHKDISADYIDSMHQVAAELLKLKRKL